MKILLIDDDKSCAEIARLLLPPLIGHWTRGRNGRKCLPKALTPT
jgi:hypothetical protein